MVTQALSIARSSQKRLHEVDIIKFLAIIGVVIIHIGFKSRFSEEAIVAINILQTVFAWSVFAFFFCSGLLFKSHKIRPENFKIYVIGKAQRLLFPCVIFSVLYKILQISLSSFNLFSWSVDFPISVDDWIFFLFSPVSPQFYFLTYLFLVSTLFFLACLGLRTVLLTHGGLLAFCLTFYLQSVPPDQPHGPSFSLLPIYALCFSWGVALSADHGRVNNIMISGLSSAAVLFLSYWNQSLLFSYVLVPVFLYALLQKLPGLNEKISCLRLGDKSSAIYVWHAPLVLPFWSIIADRFVGFDFVEIPLIIGLTIMSSCLISAAVERIPILKILRF